ncbi:hypothetical protein [Alteromonas sp.]|jgi:hypothetical protein|uniref:hypothetical protein n=1 Tax=Alteromonas sp. TaxID=232 RepID=UPI003AEE986E|tara:strand:- start:99 stop:731 length:633 start_codon:yes stop_codon:yes gene_type:complete
MEFDIKGYIIALLLGILSGLGLANVFNLDFSTAITTAGTFMAGIGAIGTVYIAYRALHSWKEKVAYDTLKLSVSNALVLLDRVYIDGNSIRLQSVKLFTPNGGITGEMYLQSAMNVIEIISKYNFYVLDMELYSRKIGIQPDGLDSLVKNRKSNVMRSSLKKMTDLAVKGNESKSINTEELDTMAKDFYETINTEKKLVHCFYKDLVNEF